MTIACLLACACGTGGRSCRAPAGGGDASAEGASSFRLVGRFDGTRFSWSGSTVRARFLGPSLVMRLRVPAAEKSTPYTVRIDDGAPFTVDATPDRERYPLAGDLDPARPHEVTIVREAEAFAGVHELLGLDLGPGGSFLPDRPRALRIEIVGDSITCGFGVTGEPPCGFSFATERASAAYGARLGSALDADVTTLCWSGRGVLRNYDGTARETMPELFELAVPTEPKARWDFGKGAPADVVVIALGTNDFQGGGGQPLDLDAFEAAYERFARRVREVYPAALLLLTTSPMLHHVATPSGQGLADDLLRGRLEHVVARRTAAGDRAIELVQVPDDAPHWGCGGHPDAAMNVRIADRLTAVIRSRLHR
ncbi:MAG TPA: GDSL-type esterase/lipase family protein [Labilithrix sp.]|nr:GDSL-type esterase/lipase family protein [Labilithrix sp.]